MLFRRPMQKIRSFARAVLLFALAVILTALNFAVSAFFITLMLPIVLTINICSAWLAALFSCLSLHNVSNWLYDRVIISEFMRTPQNNALYEATYENYGLTQPVNITSRFVAIKLAAHITVDSLLLAPLRMIFVLYLSTKMNFDLMTLNEPELSYPVFSKSGNKLVLDDVKIKKYTCDSTSVIAREVSVAGIYNAAKRNCICFSYASRNESNRITEAKEQAATEGANITPSNSGLSLTI